MKLIENVQYKTVELELRLVKKYPRFVLFDVVKDGEVLYRESFTPLQLSDDRRVRW